MQNGRKTNLRNRQPRPAGSLPGRSQQWASNGPRPEPRGSHNARRDYERYLALAQAEVQAGDKVAAENYYPARRTLFQVDVLSTGSNRPRRARGISACYEPPARSRSLLGLLKVVLIRCC